MAAKNGAAACLKFILIRTLICRSSFYGLTALV
jgi:hypothetical protein